MASQMLSSPRDSNPFNPSQDEISSSQLEQIIADNSKLEAAPGDAEEFEPELESESDTDTDSAPEVTRVFQEEVVHALSNEQIEVTLTTKAGSDENDNLPPPPPPQSVQESNVSSAGSTGNNRSASKHQNIGNIGANAIYWEEARKPHVGAGSKSSAEAVKVELEELRRKQLAKSGKNMLSEKAMSEANNHRSSLQSPTFSPSTAGYLSEVEFYLSQRARSNELKKQQMETFQFYHSYRGKNLAGKKAQSNSPTRNRDDERRHSYSPSACPFGTSPRTSAKGLLSSSMTASLGSAGFPLSTLDETFERSDVERRATSEPLMTDMSTLEEDMERRLSKYSPRTQKSIREAIAREMLNEGALPEPELNDPLKWDEKVNDCPDLPFNSDGIEQLSETCAKGSVADVNYAEEKDDLESERAAMDKSGRRIASEKRKTKTKKEISTESCRKANSKNNTAPEKNLSSTHQSAKKNKESRNISTSAPNRIRSSTQKRLNEKESKEKRKGKGTPNSPVTEKIIRSPVKTRTRKVVKNENGKDEKCEQKKERRVISSRSTKVESKEGADKRTIPPKHPGKKKYFVPRVATLTKSQVPPTKSLGATSTRRAASPLPSRSQLNSTPTNRRRCNSAPTTNPSFFGSDSSDVMSVGNTRRNKSVPLYNGRSIGVDSNAKRNHLLCCDRKWEVNLHGSRAGCDRCLHFASEEEKKSFATNGHHPRIMMTRGGCHRSCTYFPRRKDEVPARLCRKCFFDTHKLKLW